MKRIALCGVAAAIVAPLCQAQSQSPMLGPQVGVFFPTSSGLRSGVSSAWYTFGLGAVDPNQTAANSDKKTDLSFISGSGNGSTVFIGVYSFNLYNQTLGSNKKANTGSPYFALRGGLAYMDYAVNTDAVTRVSSKRIGLNANAEVGFQLSRQLSVTARYDLFPSYDGLQFNGLSLSLKYGLLSF